VFPASSRVHDVKAVIQYRLLCPIMDLLHWVCIAMMLEAQCVGLRPGMHALCAASQLWGGFTAVLLCSGDTVTVLQCSGLVILSVLFCATVCDFS
jgi:hypothetical protein